VHDEPLDGHDDAAMASDSSESDSDEEGSDEE
jgi:hypothetical protein